MKKILFVASEGVPFIKTGGLADVVGSLPKYFDKRYFDCRVILPKYMCMSDKVKSMMRYRTHFYMDFMGMNEYVAPFLLPEWVRQRCTLYHSGRAATISYFPLITQEA